MVFKKVLLAMCLAAPLSADTGFTGTIRVSETDGSPACTVGQVKVSTGTLTCSGQVAIIATGGSGGGGGGSSSLPLPQGATNYIQNTETLQAGATFYVSSGTVDGQFTVSELGNSGMFSANTRMVFTSPSSTFGTFSIYGQPDTASLYPRIFQIGSYSSNGSTSTIWKMDSTVASPITFSATNTLAPNQVFEVGKGYVILTSTRASSFSSYTDGILNLVNDESEEPGNTYLDMQDTDSGSFFKVKQALTTINTVRVSSGTVTGDLEFSDYAKGVIMSDSDLCRWRTTVNTSGTLVTTLIGCPTVVVNNYRPCTRGSPIGILMSVTCP